MLENVKKKTKYIHQHLKHFVKKFDYLKEHIHRFKIFKIIKHTTNEQAILRALYTLQYLSKEFTIKNAVFLFWVNLD